MKTILLIIIPLVFSVLLFQSTYAECSEQDRDACIGEDGKFDMMHMRIVFGNQ